MSQFVACTMASMSADLFAAMKAKKKGKQAAATIDRVSAEHKAATRAAEDSSRKVVSRELHEQEVHLAPGHSQIKTSLDFSFSNFASTAPLCTYLLQDVGLAPSVAREESPPQPKRRMMTQQHWPRGPKRGGEAKGLAFLHKRTLVGKSGSD